VSCSVALALLPAFRRFCLEVRRAQKAKNELLETCLQGTSSGTQGKEKSRAEDELWLAPSTALCKALNPALRAGSVPLQGRVF